jgi:hypothetical protein
VEGDKIQLNISAKMTQSKPQSSDNLWNKMQDPTEHRQSDGSLSLPTEEMINIKKRATLSL